MKRSSHVLLSTCDDDLIPTRRIGRQSENCTIHMAFGDKSKSILEFGIYSPELEQYSPISKILSMAYRNDQTRPNELPM